MPSFPPPNTIIKSLIATARWPWRGLGHGPAAFVIRFHFSMGAAILEAASTMASDYPYVKLPGCKYPYVTLPKMSRDNVYDNFSVCNKLGMRHILVLVGWWTGSWSASIVHIFTTIAVVGVLEAVDGFCVHNFCRESIPSVDHSMTEEKFSRIQS